MREEEKKSLKSKGSKVQKYLRKRWVFPAIYIASAAVILTGVLWFQGMGNNSDEFSIDQEDMETADGTTPNDYMDNEAIEVTANQENFQMPVHDDEGIYIKMQYYDLTASEKDQEAALVFYNNTYYPNTGVDYAMESGESFDVIASLSGTVVEAQKDSLMGNYVKIKHEDEVTTHYSSLEDIFVEVGQTVDQGTVLGTAGTNDYNKDAGVHVHYEIRVNDNPVNPINFLDKPLSSVKDYEEEQKVDGNEEQGNNEEEKEVGNNEGNEEDEEETDTAEEPADDEESDEDANEEETNDVTYNMTRA